MLENDIEVRFSTKHLPFEYNLLEYRLIMNKELRAGERSLSSSRISRLCGRTDSTRGAEILTMSRQHSRILLRDSEQTISMSA